MFGFGRKKKAQSNSANDQQISDNSQVLNQNFNPGLSYASPISNSNQNLANPVQNQQLSSSQANGSMFDKLESMQSANNTFSSFSNQNTNGNSHSQSNFSTGANNFLNNQVLENKTRQLASDYSSQTQTTSSVTSQFSDVDNESAEFLNTLVEAMLGVHIWEIEESKREEVVLKCVDIFNNYIIEYVKIHFGKQNATRLQAQQKFGSEPTVFVKFPETEKEFEEAYGAFVNLLAERLN